MVHILGEGHDVAIFRTKQGRVVRYWAERGIVRVEDSAPPLGGAHYSELSIADAKHHLSNIAYMVGRQTERGVEIDQRERKSLIDWINKMAGVIRKAEEQGDPNPKFQEVISKAAARLPKRLTVSVPAKYFQE